MDVQTSVGISAQNAASAADIDSISDQMKQVRAAASSLLGKAESASNVPDLAAALENAYSGARRTAFRGEAEQDSGLIPNSIPG